MKKLKDTSNKKILLSSITIMIVTLIMGFTFSFWTRNFTQAGQNRIISDCFDIQYEETSGDITLTNVYPQTDEAGLKNKPYQVTIKNTCATPASYNVVLHRVNTSTLADQYIKVAVNGNYKLLSNYSTTTSSLSNITNARVISQGAISGNDEKTLNIVAWMEQNTSEANGVNKAFNYRITIEAVAGTNHLLAGEIFKANAVQTKEITWSSATNDLGLFKLSGSKTVDGNSTYLFRGNVENNYVKFGKTYDVLFYANDQTAYNTVSNCLIDDYSNNNCVYNTNNAEMIAEYGTDLVWRVVRINEDGNIRMILNTNARQLFDLKKEYGNSYYTDSGYQGSYLWLFTYDFIHNNLSDREYSMLANSKICNAGTVTEDNYTYENGEVISEYKNINQHGQAISPSLSCYPHEIIEESVSLLTADEYLYASNYQRTPSGYPYYKSYILKTGYSFFTMTGGWSGITNYYGNISDIMNTYYETPFTIYAHSDEETSIDSVDSLISNTSMIDTGIRPVINLKADVKVSGGDGTASNPYVIDVN